jgi:hypothetical protein
VLQDTVYVELSPRTPSRLKTKKRIHMTDQTNMTFLITTAFPLKLTSVSDGLLSSDPVYVNVIVRISNNFKNKVLEVH